MHLNDYVKTNGFDTMRGPVTVSPFGSEQIVSIIICVQYVRTWNSLSETLAKRENINHWFENTTVW